MLRGEDLRQTADMREVVQAVEEYFCSGGDRKSWQPPRNVARIQGGVWLFMPGYVEGYGVAVKTINEYPGGAASGLLELYDEKKGELLAVMDAVELTRIRTGALGGLAAKHLAREGSVLLAVVGSGRIAGAVAEAIAAVLKGIEEVRVYSRSPERRKAFASMLGDKLKLHAAAVSSPEEAVRDADIIVAATSSETPVFRGSDVKRGALVESFGVLPDRRELDPDTYRRADLIVFDSGRAVLAEAGDAMHAAKTGLLEGKPVVELADIISGKTSVRRSPSTTVLFKSVGYALLDVVVARYVYEKAAMGPARSVGNR